MAGAELDEELTVGGTGAGRYRVRVAPEEVSVGVAPPDSDSRIDAGALADALSGRGDDVASVCGRRDAATDALSTLRAFFLTPA
jgi:hypothetical protein